MKITTSSTDVLPASLDVLQLDERAAGDQKREVGHYMDAINTLLIVRSPLSIGPNELVIGAYENILDIVKTLHIPSSTSPLRSPPRLCRSHIQG